MPWWSRGLLLLEGLTRFAYTVVINYALLIFWLQLITIPVEDTQEHGRSDDPPIHYTGGAKVTSYILYVCSKDSMLFTRLN